MWWQEGETPNDWERDSLIWLREGRNTQIIIMGHSCLAVGGGQPKEWERVTLMRWWEGDTSNEKMISIMWWQEAACGGRRGTPPMIGRGTPSFGCGRGETTK